MPNNKYEAIRKKAIRGGVPKGFVPFDQREPRTGRVRKKSNPNNLTAYRRALRRLPPVRGRVSPIEAPIVEREIMAPPIRRRGIRPFETLP